MANKPITKTQKTVKKPTRTTALKSSAKTSFPAQDHKFDQTPKLAKNNAFRIKRSYVILVVIILAFAAFLFFFRNLFIAAVVNGQPISSLTVVNQPQKQSGSDVMNTLVRNLLIEQEANKQHITVSDKEVDDEIKKIQDNLSKQGQKIDQVLKAQKMTTQDLRRLVRLDKLVGKMVGKDIKVSDKEVNDYIAKNKDVLPQNANKDQLKKQVADQIKTQKTNEKVRTWLSDMQSKAHIQYFVTYP